MEVIKIPVAYRHKVKYTYTVEGYGSFPIDMLRYDNAYPRDSDSIYNMGQELDRRQVRLASCHCPTHDRWASFGWKVI